MVSGGGGLPSTDSGVSPDTGVGPSSVSVCRGASGIYCWTSVDPWTGLDRSSTVTVREEVFHSVVLVDGQEVVSSRLDVRGPSGT